MLTVDYEKLPAGACRRFKARSLTTQGVCGTGLVHPDGSAVIQWWNIKSGGPASTEFSTEDEWRPFFLEWDTRAGGEVNDDPAAY